MIKIIITELIIIELIINFKLLKKTNSKVIIYEKAKQ